MAIYYISQVAELYDLEFYVAAARKRSDERRAMPVR
jgi:hypothetical protein